MKSHFLIFLLLGLILFFPSIGTAQKIKPIDEKSDIFGRFDFYNYIDIYGLSKSFERGEKDFFDVYNSKRKPDDFFQSFKWNFNECWAGSVLKEDVTAYCFPYLSLGYPVTIYQGMPERFISPDVGIAVWYEAKNNRFYLYNGWNSEYALGPFDGEPLAALTKAIKPRKEKRSFPGVELEFKSQNWTFPDMSEPLPPWSCATNYCPQFEIIEKYQSVTTHLRLINKSKKILYYLADNSEKAYPVGNGLSRKIGKSDWQSADFLKMSGVGAPATRWMPLPSGAALDFEIIGRGFEGYDYAYSLALNDAPVYWDEVNLILDIPAKWRKFKNDRFK